MSQAKATLTLRKIDDTFSVINILGEITAAAEKDLMDVYNRATQAGAKVLLLNFSGLDYMNSSGIGLLVTLLIRMKRQGQRLMAYGLSDHYRQIFQLTRLDEAISICTSEQEAMALV
jgi:anti-sigma B factor antagonist